jgi:hypothetical protein
MATLMTNLTTAIGFATFVASNNQLLLEFEWLHPSISWHFSFVHYCDSYFSQLYSSTKRTPYRTDRLCKGFYGWILRNVKYNRFPFM